MVILTLFLVVESISFVIPPLQSPDESNHLARAYLLSKGEIFLKTPTSTTGGDIDVGLLTYIAVFDTLPFQYQAKVRRTDVIPLDKLSWTGRKQFRGLPNTAVYLPLPYLPQALALFVGEHTHLSIDTTYYLTRLFSLITTLSLFLTSALLYPMPIFVLTLFITPMTLFQLGSASLDAVTFGTSALTGALFLRGTDLRFSFDSRMHAGLILCGLSLATSRIALIPLALLPLHLYFKRGLRSYMVSSVSCFLLSATWIAYALMAVKGMPAREVGIVGTSLYYASHPLDLLTVIFNTLTNPDILWAYWAQLIGVLGYGDTPVDPYIYNAFAISLSTIVVISVKTNYFSRLHRSELILFLAAVLSLILTFGIELVTWTPTGDKKIDGVQGRYFTPILILCGYALFRAPPRSTSIKWGCAITFLSAILSIAGTVPKLLYRYWLG
jgi:uncharacterized membrane protein